MAIAHNGHWRAGATAAMLGMSSVEWSEYLRDILGVDLAPDRIVDLVVANLLGQYRRRLPLIPGAVAAVRRIGRRWPLALASSAGRPVIDAVLAISGLRREFQVTVSSEEVPRGKPAPDVYLEAARRLGQPPRACAAVEDSANGIRSALAAGLRVVAVPTRTTRHRPASWLRLTLSSAAWPSSPENWWSSSMRTAKPRMRRLLTDAAG